MNELIRVALSTLHHSLMINLFSDDERGGRSVEAIDPATGTPMHALGGRGENIIQRLDATQSRWKRQVQEQRRNIYDKHNMLN